MLVIGGGMAGLVAALAAAGERCDVAVIEPDAAVGGSARFSSGRVWSLPGYDALREAVPLGDATLQRAHSERLQPALDWLSALVPLVPQAEGKSGVGRVMTLGRPGERTEYFAALAEIARSRGVRFHHGWRATAARFAAGGVEVDAEAVESGAPLNFLAGAVVIATGGFQGDRARLESIHGEAARHLMLRSNPHSTGDGLRIGLALGGAVSRGLAAFYGKAMPRFAELSAPQDFKAHTLDAAKGAIAVNAEGMRFVDETSGLSGEGLANAALYQRDGAFYVLFDGSQVPQLQVALLDALAERAGVEREAILVEAGSTDALAAAMEAAWDVPAAAIMETVRTVNAAAVRGTADSLRPGRGIPPVALAQPPFVAVACQVGITIPFGGLLTDAEMRLQSAGAALAGNVLVAGADAGGIYFGAYAGGLAWALTSGLAAGRNAAAAVRRERSTAAA